METSNTLKFETIFFDYEKKIKEHFSLFPIKDDFNKNLENRKFFCQSQSGLVAAYKMLFIQLFKIRKNAVLTSQQKDSISTVLHLMLRENLDQFGLSDYSFEYPDPKTSDYLAENFLKMNHVSINAIIEAHKVFDSLMDFEFQKYNTKFEIPSETEDLKILSFLLFSLRARLSKKINLF